MIFGTLSAQANDPNICADFNKAKAAYEADGYLIYDFGFSDDILDQVTEATSAMVGQYVRVQDMWRSQPSVKSLGAHADVMGLLGQLYDRAPFPFQTLNFSVGTQQATHADCLHFSSSPDAYMCGVWVALEDIDMNNGPLHYFAGSHKRGSVSMDDIDAKAGGDIIQYFDQESRPYEKKYGLIKKGQAVIWAANLLHGGDPIIDEGRTRLSQVTHYFFEDCLYTTPLNRIARPRAYIRYPYDFSKGRFVCGRKDGAKVRPHLRTFLSAHAKNIMRYAPSYK